ncbi:sugar transferase [Sphingomonas sp. CFBP9019]|jgi:lipopolysaccharide/colanic/teichoic acid biosynthesis glycosyltransferase|uniref:sugar transferase n=1 Tax=Sphingomonas sp. CFBP9019 TaxID=3096532 RepID=UPI002A6B096A|nr:sugar transferase [Sphingomonas sp. CFBP9019]MDY1008814.1 sugar transferase [Sphingomonas sp. CFBP9019]
MLMTRQAVASPSRSVAIVGRYRFQLTALWLLAVVLPGLYVYAGFITAESNRAILNSAVAAALASFVALVMLRRINDFPGIRSYAFILPSLAAAYGATLVLIFGLRLAYSRSVLTGSFVLAVITVFVLVYMTERIIKLLFFVVPGGDVDSLEAIEAAEWVRLKEPTAPTNPRAMLVADFRYDHDDDWERLLARAAVGGQLVYHSKLLRESLTGKVTIEHLSENSFGSLLPNLAYHKFKRMADLLVCLALAPLLLVPMIAIALLIKLDSPGPVIFRQRRVGYRSEVFEMFKFRSMRPREAVLDQQAARQDAMTQSDDDRITRIGRFLRQTRLDELPQILNIVRGEMSWIGPRPEAVPLSQWYENEIPFYSYRHIIRPGISGWAQVQQGHVTDLSAVSEKLAYDFYYVKYFSAWLDMVIAFRTIPTMIGGFGAR